MLPENASLKLIKETGKLFLKKATVNGKHGNGALLINDMNWPAGYDIKASVVPE